MYADTFKLMSMGMSVRMNINPLAYKSRSIIIYAHIKANADTCLRQSIHAFKIMSKGTAV